jgi:Mn2+/Fe2+ NRAMP family transporter
MKRLIHISATVVVMAVAVYIVVCGAKEGRLAECLVLTAMICPVLLFVLALLMETAVVLLKLRKSPRKPAEEKLGESAQEV